MKIPALPMPSERTASMTSVIFAAVLLVSALINWLGLTSDPYRCGALLQRGSWLDPPDSHGDRIPFSKWQPDGCMLRKYGPKDIKRCMEGRHMLFSGDSTTRQVFWGMARLLDRKGADQAREKATTHSSYDMTFSDVHMVQIWNPYLESNENNPELTQELELYSKERHSPVSVKDQKSAGLIMLGVGSWFALHNYNEEGYKKFTAAIDNVTDLIGHRDLPRWGTYERPIEPLDGTGSEVFFAPVAPPLYDELPDKRKTEEGLQVGEVESYNEYLNSIAGDRHLTLVPSFPALSYGQPAAIHDREVTGFHVINSVAETKATILLNARCNAKLDAMDGYPHDRTCCTDYGSKSDVQHLLLFLGALYVAACVAVEARSIWRPEAAAASPRRPYLNFEVAIFIAAVLCCHYFDRTQMMAKGSKQYVPREFQFLSALSVLAALVSFRRSRSPPPPTHAPANTPSEPEKGQFLSRDQTEEWKGWMQLAILIYHWTGAGSYDIYVFIRLCVAAYLFQTGYGHSIYFMAKKDFSFKRVAATLLRLNLLSCALPFAMNTDYMFYYFAPLVSFWFLIVWATFAVGAKYNGSIVFVFAKIAISMLVISSLVLGSPIQGWVFAGLRTVFNIKWNLKEWEYRVALDAFIVYVGMLTGVAFQAVKNMRIHALLHQLAAGMGGVAMYAFWYACKYQIKGRQDYIAWHPYISFIPILGFIAVRNIPGTVRLHTSRAMAWVGRCSLETFTLQFHIFLAADTKGVLRLGLFSGDGSLFHDRIRDLLIIIPFFLWLSYRLADATANMVKLLTAETPRQEEQYNLDHEPKPEEDSSMGSRFGMGRVAQLASSKSSWLSDLRVRMGLLLGVMWFLNLVY